MLAIPFTSIDQLPAAAMNGKVVVDATNYWAPRDGHIAVIDSGATTSSEMVAERLPGAHVVKAFNSMTAADMNHPAIPGDRAERRAVPIAGNDASKEIVAALIDEIGLDVVDLGPLAAGRSIDPCDAWEGPLGARETETLMRSRLTQFRRRRHSRFQPRRRIEQDRPTTESPQHQEGFPPDTRLTSPPLKRDGL